MTDGKERIENLPFSEADRGRLQEIMDQMPLIAEVTNADVFLDILLDEEKALVIAESCPAQGTGLYRSSVLGAYALPENEPAVFHAFRAAVPVCDLKAVTQEGRAVRQNVAPVFGEEGRVIAVLIREKDISTDLKQQRKYEELARSYEEQHDPIESARAGGAGINELREMHHRVKNDLQLVASILRLQARKAEYSEIRETLEESVGRVLSIAAIHDILTYNPGAAAAVRSRAIMEKLCESLSALIPPDREIRLLSEGDDIELDPDTATTVSMAVTELVTNALIHAFPPGSAGTVLLTVRKGTLFHAVTVADDGIGFEDAEAEGLGLSIVRSLVRDKLGGKLHISSGDRGTKVSFDFQNK
ncbi:MAG: sensor histidine kinase [Lachnospiraceae bacterium]|nr:sensor histidine kinase [Lachnospiraceae bacterium]